MTYKTLQRRLQVQKLRYKYPEIFNKDEGGGRFINMNLYPLYYWMERITYIQKFNCK